MIEEILKKYGYSSSKRWSENFQIPEYSDKNDPRYNDNVIFDDYFTKLTGIFNQVIPQKQLEYYGNLSTLLSLAQKLLKIMDERKVQVEMSEVSVIKTRRSMDVISKLFEQLQNNEISPSQFKEAINNSKELQYSSPTVNQSVDKYHSESNGLDDILKDYDVVMNEIEKQLQLNSNFNQPAYERRHQEQLDGCDKLLQIAFLKKQQELIKMGYSRKIGTSIQDKSIDELVNYEMDFNSDENLVYPEETYDSFKHLLSQIVSLVVSNFNFVSSDILKNCKYLTDLYKQRNIPEPTKLNISSVDKFVELKTIMRKVSYPQESILTYLDSLKVYYHILNINKQMNLYLGNQEIDETKLKTEAITLINNLHNYSNDCEPIQFIRYRTNLSGLFFSAYRCIHLERNQEELPKTK